MRGDHRLKRSGSIIAGAVALPLALGGCAIVPPLVGAIAYGIDGISLVVSGKTTTDHAVSAMAEQDCRLWRLLILEAVCRPEEVEADTAIAIAEAAVEGNPASVPAVLPRTATPRPVPAAALTASAFPAPPPILRPPILQPQAKPGVGPWPPVAFEAPAQAVSPTPASPPVLVARAAELAQSAAAGERYLVLGTFRQRGNAESLAGRMLDAGAVITDPEPGIGQFHRVVIGPLLGTAELPRLRQQVQARGVNGAWMATLCLNTNAVEQSCGAARPMATPVATLTAALPPTRAIATTMPGTQIAARTLALSTDPIY